MSLTLFLYSECIHQDQDVLVFRHLNGEHLKYSLTLLFHWAIAQAASKVAASHVKEIGSYQACTEWECFLSCLKKLHTLCVFIPHPEELFSQGPRKIQFQFSKSSNIYVEQLENEEKTLFALIWKLFHRCVCYLHPRGWFSRPKSHLNV